MPGGRLTAEDRQRVAAGIAAGQGFAEIARQLGRPTSTISREVDRNGGPGGYLSEHAQEATSRRARRAKSPVEPPLATEAYGRDIQAVAGFLEQFVALMVETGLPRMVARVFAALVTSDTGGLTAAQLVQRLRVSPASVSKAIGYLEGLGLVRRERDQRRRERYVVDDDLWQRTWKTDAERHRRWADTARRGVYVFGAGTPAGDRLETMSRFFTHLAGEMAGGPLSTGAVEDMLSVLAALVYAAMPLSVDQLAHGLGWTPDRVDGALRAIEQYPDVADPILVERSGRNEYRTAVKSDRLSAVQRQALRSLSS